MRSRPGSLVSGALLLLLLAGCQGPAKEETWAPFCAEPADDRVPESWVSWPLGELVVALPPGFEPVLEPSESYPHGGAQWRDGQRRVELVWGQWGPRSVEAAGLRWCLTEIGGNRVVLLDAPPTDAVWTAAWYLTDPHSTEPLMRAISDRQEDRELLLRILRSQRLFDGGEPRV